MKKQYKINEIFYSLQAEGGNCGVPSVFIRFSGCNLNCPWCDTKNHIYGTFYTLEDIKNEVDKCLGNIKRSDVNLVLTGGEPTLQLDLINDKIIEGFNKICIETNGTKKVPSWVDFITCSPKSDIPFEEFPSVPNEIKIVYEPTREPYLLKLLSSVPANIQLYLQPLEVNGKFNFEETVSFIKKHPRFHLSLQYHKLIGIR